MPLLHHVPTTGVLRSQRWLRGPAWLDRAHVVFDADRAAEYSPIAERGMGIDLAHVRTPADAVTFATKYGLLKGTAGGFNITGLVRQRANDFIAAGTRLAVAVRAILDVQAALRGDRDALQRLRLHATKRFGRDHSERMTEADLLGFAGWAAWEISEGFARATPFFYDRAQQGENVPPGSFRFGVSAPDLLAMCHVDIAIRLAEKEPFAVCPECDRLFVVDDARQRFCSPKCANRKRFREFKKKREGRGERGKTTRKR